MIAYESLNCLAFRRDVPASPVIAYTPSQGSGGGASA